MPTMHYVRGRESGPKRIFIAVPTYSGEVCDQFTASLFESIQVLGAAGIAIDLCIESGNCHVDDARNSLVRQFIETDCTDLVFIDSDVGWGSESLLRLVSYGRDLVAGIYPKKQEPLDFPVLMESGKEIWADKDGLVEVVGAPTGFMRISRKCIEALIDADKARRFSGQDGKVYTPVFERLIASGRRMSGDYAFCHKWRSTGGKIYIDPEIHFTHSGSFTWKGHLGDHWRNLAGIESPLLYRSIERLKSGDEHPSVFNDIYVGLGNHWAATPELIACAYHYAKKYKGNILETGSGLTTLVMAIANPNVYSLEHDFEYLKKTQKLLQNHGLTSHLKYCPIKQYDGFSWYQETDLPESFDFVLCDGPNRKFGRAGLFKILGDRIKGTVLMDDAGDHNQLILLEEWSATKGRKIKTLGDDRLFAVSEVVNG